MEKCTEGSSLKTQLDKVSRKYLELSQRAYYTDFYKLQPQLVKKVSAHSDLGKEVLGDNGQVDLVLVFGANTTDDFDKYCLTFVKVFSE